MQNSSSIYKPLMAVYGFYFNLKQNVVKFVYTLNYLKSKQTNKNRLVDVFRLQSRAVDFSKIGKRRP